MSEASEIRVFRGETESMGPVTQEWCDTMAMSVRGLSGQRALMDYIRKLHVIKDYDKQCRLRKFIWDEFGDSV